MTRSYVSESTTLKGDVFKLLDKNHELKALEICAILGLDHATAGQTVRNYRVEWKRNFKNRHALKCLKFHNVRGWLQALKTFDKTTALKTGWLETRARNRMFLWKDKVGRVEWFETGRVNVWIKKPATKGRVKQLLANAFFKTGLLKDVQVFDLWADSLRLKGAHLTMDTGERLPYAKIDYLKEALGVTVKIGDVTDPTCVEIEFTYPDWAERNEVVLRQNTTAFQQFGAFLQDLVEPKKPSRDFDKSMVV